jgi:iron complex outermembrane recepter protein
MFNTKRRQTREKIMSHTNIPFRFFLGISAACFPFVAAAQTPPTTTASGLEDIIVTATRRAEPLQDISTSVTAFTPATLERSSITNTFDLQTRTPNLIFSTNGSFGQPYVRGVGSDQITPGFDPPVATYIDGSYQARPTASIVDFFDVERVEVLKGPQGALYG